MTDDSSLPQTAAPRVQDAETTAVTRELPDDLRIPLHELQADAGYLIGRVAADGGVSGLILQALETKLSHVAEAAYRLNGSRNDLVAALRSAIAVADEARDEWDAAPAGMKAGKLLIALSGHLPGYRADIDAIHAAIAKAEVTR